MAASLITYLGKYKVIRSEKSNYVFKWTTTIGLCQTADRSVLFRQRGEYYKYRVCGCPCVGMSDCQEWCMEREVSVLQLSTLYTKKWPLSLNDSRLDFHEWKVRARSICKLAKLWFNWRVRKFRFTCSDRDVVNGGGVGILR